MTSSFPLTILDLDLGREMAYFFPLIILDLDEGCMISYFFPLIILNLDKLCVMASSFPLTILDLDEGCVMASSFPLTILDLDKGGWIAYSFPLIILDIDEGIGHGLQWMPPVAWIEEKASTLHTEQVPYKDLISLLSFIRSLVLLIWFIGILFWLVFLYLLILILFYFWFDIMPHLRSVGCVFELFYTLIDDSKRPGTMNCFSTWSFYFVYLFHVAHGAVYLKT